MPEHIKAGRSGEQCIKPEKEAVCNRDGSRKTAGENYGALIFKEIYEFSYDMYSCVCRVNYKVFNIKIPDICYN